MDILTLYFLFEAAILTRFNYTKAIMRFFALYRYYRFIGMSVLDSARLAYKFRFR